MPKVPFTCYHQQHSCEATLEHSVSQCSALQLILLTMAPVNFRVPIFHQATALEDAFGAVQEGSVNSKNLPLKRTPPEASFFLELAISRSLSRTASSSFFSAMRSCSSRSNLALKEKMNADGNHHPTSATYLASSSSSVSAIGCFPGTPLFVRSFSFDVFPDLLCFGGFWGGVSERDRVSGERDLEPERELNERRRFPFCAGLRLREVRDLDGERDRPRGGSDSGAVDVTFFFRSTSSPQFETTTSCSGLAFSSVGISEILVTVSKPDNL